MTVGALFEAFGRVADACADRPAFTFIDPKHGERTYSFAGLFQEVRVIADRMRSKGIADRRAPLAILLRSQEDQTLHYLAALRAGAVPAVLTPPNRKQNREYYTRTLVEVLRRSQFGAIITDMDEFDMPVPSFAPRTIEGRQSDPHRERVRGAALPADASFLQFSSGTTGIKRGVLVSDDAVLQQMRTYAGAVALDETDIIVSWLPLYHDMGFIACLNMPLLFGVHTVVIDPIEWVTRPSLLLRSISSYHGTLSWNPNFAYAFMAQRVRDTELDGLDLSFLRGLINCSEPVTHTSQQQFMDRFQAFGLRPDVFKGCYAMAETTFAVTHGEASASDALDYRGPTASARSPGADPHVSVGRALDGVDLQVIGDEGRPRGEREIGEFWVRSPFNFTGYYGDPDATERAFVDGWYRTGDLGYRVGDMYFVTGRLKDVLIVGGVNVFPSDVEDVASRVDGIVPGRTVAFARFDSRLQTDRITVLAESDLEGDEARAAMLQVRQWIQASFEIASFDVHLVPPGWLVKSSSGKIARSENRAKWERTDHNAGS